MVYRSKLQFREDVEKHRAVIWAFLRPTLSALQKVPAPAMLPPSLEGACWEPFWFVGGQVSSPLPRDMPFAAIAHWLVTLSGVCLGDVRVVAVPLEWPLTNEW